MRGHSSFDTGYVRYPHPTGNCAFVPRENSETPIRFEASSILVIIIGGWTFGTTLAGGRLGPLGTEALAGASGSFFAETGNTGTLLFPSPEASCFSNVTFAVGWSGKLA